LPVLPTEPQHLEFSVALVGQALSGHICLYLEAVEALAVPQVSPLAQVVFRQFKQIRTLGLTSFLVLALVLILAPQFLEEVQFMVAQVAARSLSQRTQALVVLANLVVTADRVVMQFHLY
jgi:hypothetical protein